MILECRHPIRGRIQMPLVALRLLGLLLVFFSSVTHQPASAFAARSDQGFVGALDHLVVASHNESFRAQGANHKNELLLDGDPDLPGWWVDDSAVVLAERCGNTCVASVGTSHLRSAARFLNPLLRAPPLT